MLTSAKIILFTIFFIVTGGAVFARYFRNKKPIIFFAGLVAVISAGFLMRDVNLTIYKLLETNKEKTEQETQIDNNFFEENIQVIMKWIHDFKPKIEIINYTNDRIIENFGIIKDCKECPEMIKVPSGKFLMGSKWNSRGHTMFEEPQRYIDIKSFALAKFELTVGQFSEFVKSTNYESEGCYLYRRKKNIFSDNNIEYVFVKQANWISPGYKQDNNSPATCLNWNDAIEYVKWLSKKTNKEYRLPSETEWEYVAKSSKDTIYPWGDHISDICMYANTFDAMASFLKNNIFLTVVPIDSYGTSYRRSGIYSSEIYQTQITCNDKKSFATKIGTYQPTPWGFYDLLGNVAEWTHDTWTDTLINIPKDGEAYTQYFDGIKTIKGGSWVHGVTMTRPASRIPMDKENRYDFTGFRLARTLRESY